MAFATNFIVLDSVDSTNNYAANVLKASEVAEGTVVLAYYQSHGRGQRGNSWISESGKSLLMSLILKPEYLEATDQFVLNQVMCLGLVRFLKHGLGIDAVIKWPNDILVNGNKLAGMLIENTLRGSRVEHTIVGIGLNLNQSEFPNELPATSLKIITGKEYDCAPFAQELMPYLEEEYRKMFDVRNVENRYLQHLLGYRKPLWYRKAGEEFLAEITGLGPHGELQLRTAHGTELSCGFKEIELLRKNF